MFSKYTSLYINMLNNKQKLNYNLFNINDINFIEQNTVYFNYMNDLLGYYLADKGDLKISYKFFLNLKNNPLFKNLDHSNEHIYFVLSLCLLYAYVSAPNITLTGKIFKKRRDLIFLSNLNLNKIIQNLAQINDTNHDSVHSENLFLNILGFIETSCMSTNQIISFNKKKDKLVRFQLDINMVGLDLDLLGIYTSPVQTHPNVKYSYYVNVGFLNHLSYIRNNNFGNKSLKIFNLSTLHKMCSQKYFIDDSLLKYALNILMGMFNFNVTSSEELLQKLHHNYKFNIKHVESREDNYSKILQIHALFKFSELPHIYKNGFYYSYYYDFRGRLYSDSKINYSNNRWVRCLLSFGEFSIYEIRAFKISLQDQNIWNTLGLSITAQNEFHQYFIISIFYELGKLIKSNSSYYDGQLTREQFIKLGVDLYNDTDNKLYNLKDLDFYEKTILVYKLQNSVIFYKQRCIFYKDSTASGLQILSLFLKPKNEQVRNWLNLNPSQTYHDTYVYIIQLFTKKVNIEPEFQKFFTRKTLKKTIMIFNDQGTYYTCLTDFLSHLPTDLGLLTKKKLEMIFKKFYEHLGEVFNGTELFQYNANNIFNLFILSNPTILNTLTLLKTNPTSKKINSLLENFSSLDKSWITNMLIQSGEAKQFDSNIDLTLLEDIQNYLTKLDEESHTNDLDSFMDLIKRHALLKFFKLFFKKDKFLVPINFSNYKNSGGHLTRDKQKHFLTNVLTCNTSVNPSMFSLMFSDGFLVNYDYVKTVDKKIDIKQIYTTEHHNVGLWLSMKYGYTYTEPKYNYRATLNITELIKDIDFDRIESSVKANLIHSIDASIIRKFIAKSKFPCVTIHDCIGCDLQNYHLITSIMSEIYSHIEFKLNSGDTLVLKNTINSDYLLI